MLGIINLGVSQEYYANFKTAILGTLNGFSTDCIIGGAYDFDYTKLNPDKIKEIFDICDTLVLSPGNAKVGLLTPERAESDPGIPKLYDLIEKAVEAGIPLLGVNAGHEAINCAYGWAIDKVDDSNKEDYQKETILTLKELVTSDQVLDPIFGEDDNITIRLSNGYAVLPRKKQKPRQNQDKVTQLADHMGYPLISRVKSEAPVYGFQFNIQPGTEQMFRNFFELAKQYHERKQG